MSNFKPIPTKQRLNTWNRTMTHKKPTRLYLASSNSYLSDSYDHSRESWVSQTFDKMGAIVAKHPIVSLLLAISICLLHHAL